MKHPIPDEMPGNGLSRILTIMRQLRDKEDGCPWDVEQTFETISPYTIEEAYEVADAIARNDTVDLVEELGDLLLQVVFQAQIAEEAGLFSFDDVAHSVSNKMIHRHPHVFEDKVYADVEEQKVDWERIKSEEKRKKHAAKLAAGLPVAAGDPRSALLDVPTSLPALTASNKIQEKAARVGFDHPLMSQIYGKVEEELAEVKEEAVKQPLDFDALEMEVGDLLFVAAAVGRRLKVNPETALHKANAKFVRRFKTVEEQLEFRWEDRHIDELNDAWNAVKRLEKSSA